MKGKMSLLTRKIFASIVAISMSIPPTAFANAPEPVVYDANSSIMGLAPKKEDQAKVENTDQTKIEKDLGDYSLEITSTLDESLTKIDYTIKAKRKNQAKNENPNQVSDENLSLTIAKTPTSNIKDIKLISASVDTEEAPEIKGDLNSLTLKSKANDEIIYKLRADVRKAKDGRSYELIMGLKDDAANIFAYTLKAETGIRLVDNEEVQTIELNHKDEKLSKAKGEYKKEGILGGLFASHDTITWTDYIVNEEENNKEITYDFDLDQNQETANSQIGLDYYEWAENGFEIKKEFSQKIDFSKKVKFEIPKGFIAKLSLQTKVSKKNTKIKSYSLNNSRLKNPIYIEGNEEEKSNDEEDPAPADKNQKPAAKPAEEKKTSTEIKVDDQKSEENKKTENKKEEKNSDTQITVTDANGNEIPVEEKINPRKETISAIILNKDSLIARLKAENKITADSEAVINSLAQNLESYNEGKITDQDLKDFTKALATNNKIEKSDLRSYLEAILSGLNKQQNKAANLNYDEIITYAYPEKKESPIKVDDKKTEEKSQDKKENPTKDKSSVEKSESKPASEKKAEKPADKKSEISDDKKAENKSAIKVFDANLDKLKKEAKKEGKKETGLVEGLKSLLGQTDLQKADKELKQALADKSKGLAEIQNLLDSFETKYKLSKADQAKLMDDNGDAIKKLIEKDKDNNFRPHIFAAEELNLEGKKFNIMTRFETSNALGPIQPGQFFNIHLDKKLKVNDPSSLEPIRYNGQVIATPTYNSKDNIIEYKIVKEIPENIKTPLNIPVDYNTANITLDSDGTFTVINKVSGLGLIKPPKDLVPQKVDKNGNPAGSIIEPGRGDVPELIEADDKSYKVDVDAYGTPDVVNGVLKGFNWTATVLSTTNLNGIDFHINFTTVKGSGLGEIQNLTQDGTPVTKDQNNIKGSLGIEDSIHYQPARKDGNKFTYTFYTPTTADQETYMLDINAMANGKVGAKRIVGTGGWPKDKVEDLTPNRVGMNNRTTILGEFTSDTSSTWTVTDAVSTGDDGSLPLAKRSLSESLSLDAQKGNYTAVYGLDNKGKMVRQKDITRIDGIPEEGTNPGANNAPGTIAVYKFYTTKSSSTKSNTYSLGGVEISLHQDLSIDQNWSLDTGAKMPAQDIKAVDPANENNVLGTKHVDAATDDLSTRRITIPNVKVWSINADGKATKVQPKIQQVLPKEIQDQTSGKTFQYLENYNYYESDKKEYYIHNRAVVKTEKKYGNFILNKTDADGKPLQGASFRLFPGPEVLTDKEGKATFANIEPGTYTLMEVKAPAGYKLAADTKIVIDENGHVKSVGENASQEDDKTATQYYEDERYPAFMNVKSYAVGKRGGKMTTYIYLKPTKGGGTNQNTRLDIVGYLNDNNLSVKVFDVSPGQRKAVSEAMDLQESPELNAGGNVLGAIHKHAITGKPNVYDSYTTRTGYQIKFPTQRFDGDWGFLVKIEGTNNSTDGTVSYDWLTDTNPANNAKIRQAIYPVDPSKTSNNTGGTTGNKTKDTIVTIKNQKFETSPVEVTKVTTDKDRLGKATFVLRDSDNNILKTITSVSTEGKDKGKVDFGKMPPGHYVIEEVASPDGYIESQLVFDVLVDEKNQVTYTARFKDGKGTPTQGVDYWIENEEIADEDTKVPVTTVNQKMYISENNPGERGTQDGVWEAYRYESLNYEATITTSKAKPGGRLTIQFDHNLDFTQYVNEIPKIIDNGDVIAEPYFNYDSNTLTYVFTDKAKGGELNFSLKIQGIIPSKFYAKNSGTYYFTNVVAPGQTNVQGNQKDKNIEIKAFYDDYDSAKDGSQPTQMYYFRDVYKEGDQWYVKALAYYNPKANAQGGRRDARTLSFNWMTTNWFPDRNIARWEGYGKKPAYELDDLKVYRVLPVPTGFKNFVTNEPNMPRSMGIIPENDPNTYNLVYSRKIDPDKSLYDRQGNISVTYDPSKIISNGGVNTSLPLSVSMPQISPANEGYVIEQTFKVTDLDLFRSRFRTFYMTNGNLESAFASKVNLNESAASQASKEIPKYYKQRIMMANEKYVPTKFSIKKFSEADKKLLAGAVFTLTDKSGKAISRTTGTDGILTFDNLKPGEYTLKETTAPKDYNKIDKTWNINVSKDGYVTIREIRFDGQGDYLVGDNLTLDVANRPTGTDFKVYKKDDTNQPLQGAEFTLTKDGSVVQTVKSDINGLVNFQKLTKGTYILEETKAPAGYKQLTKKWVVEVGTDNKAKVYEYKDPKTPKPDEKENTDATKSLYGETGTKWVDVAKRPLDGWTLDDNRWGGYTGNNHQPYKMGTRILGINKGKNYVIQRYVINPEGNKVNLNYASIHREKPWYNNMDWYNGETYKIFTLDKPVTGYVEDIRLQDYNITNITSSIKTEKKVISGENRLYLNFENKNYDKPIIIDVKVPYKSEDGGVGTGMDLYSEDKVYWKSDYYEKVSSIVEGNDVVKKDDPSTATNIKGDHVSDDSLDVANEKERHDFKFKKVDQDKDTDAVTGATFKLQGPKVDDKNLGPEVWAHSGKDGMVNFKGLVPGVYKLTETGAAQGYEPSHTDWTVFVKKDGKIYIRDNKSSTGGQTNPDTQWQKVSPNGKETNKTYANLPNNPPKVATQIVEVNRKLNKFRQVFIINERPEELKNTYFELHAQEETRSLNDSNIKIVSLKEIGQGSTPADIKNPGIDVTYKPDSINKNGFDRIRIKPNVAGPEHRLALTIEGDIPYSGTIGTGLDFYNYGSYDQNNKYNGNHYWAAEHYKSLNDMTLQAADPSSTGRSRSVYVGTNSVNSTPQPASYSLRTNSAGIVERTINPAANDGIEISKPLPSLAFRSASLFSFADGLEIGDEIIGDRVGAGQGWETVDPSRSKEPNNKSAKENHYENIHETTKIIAIDKTNKRIKQRFIFYDDALLKKNKRNIQIHRESEVFGYKLNKSDSTVKVYRVNSGDTIDNFKIVEDITNLSNIKDFDGAGNLPDGRKKPTRILMLIDRKYSGPFVVEIETSYDLSKNQEIGLGADYYFNDKVDRYSPKDWVAQTYNKESDINYKTAGPKVEEKEEEVRTTLPIPDQAVRRPNANMKKGEEQEVYAGQEGYQIDIYRVTYIDDVKQPNPVFVRTKEKVDPKPRIIEYGTKDEAQPQEYRVNTIPVDNGSVSAPLTAKSGSTVTVEINPDSNYEIDRIEVLHNRTGKLLTTVDISTRTFTMPANDVALKPYFKPSSTPQPTEYQITSYYSNQGDVTAKANAKPRETVQLTVTPKTGYELDTLTVKDANNQSISVNNNQFTMPASNVTITATFKEQEKSYNVGTESYGTQGSITLDPNQSRSRSAKKGEKVYFTITPGVSYRTVKAIVRELVYNQEIDGVEFNSFTGEGSFVMPASDVKVYAQFGPASGERTESIQNNETLPFETEYITDESLSPGEKVTKKAGANGEVTYNYFAKMEKGTAADAAYPAGWPQGILSRFQAMKQQGERIASFDRTEVKGTRIEPTKAIIRVGKSNDPIDDYEPQPGDIEVPADGAAEIIKIPNKKQGFVTKLFKRNAIGRPLEGATFSVNKMTDDTYKTKDKSFAPAIGTSDKDGNITFKDQAGNPIALKPGYYTLTEDKAPTGYKKITADWKIQVKDDGGRVYAVYKGPSDTPLSLINNNEKSKAGDTRDKGIIVKSRLTDINPESKTFIQRIYIDTRNHKGILNVQITPEHKREEIDRPGLPPVTIKEGVKTAYRSTYKISNPGTNQDIKDGNFDHILRTYDLSGDDVSMVNTARWRPFDWGFDEDQLNLEPGVYIVEVEGYYDDSIIDKRVTNEVKIDENYKFLNKEGNKDYDSDGKDVTKPTLKDPYDRTDLEEKDLAKLDLHVDLYEGKREFKQLKLDKNGNITYEVVDKGSYQGGAAQVTDYVKSKESEDKAKAWSGTQDAKTKYANFVGKKVKYNGKTYITGKVEPAIGEPYLHADTTINLKPIYDSAHEQELPKEGIEIKNDEETYNITFSKHGKDDPNWDDNGGEVTRNRLEGAIFKLQELAPGGYIDRPGTFVASAFNGYFGFRGLPPGRYRLMEVQAPKGYKPIKDAILYMTIKYTGDIVDGKTGEITPGKGLVTLEYNDNANGIIRYAPEKTATEEDGKLVDYVTSATAKNMGKIINEKPGKGAVTINKKDGLENALKGANFKLTRLSSKLQEDPKKPDGTTQGVSYNKESDADGVVKFEELPIGNYVLEETKSPDGYQNKGQKWYFTVGGKGLDPYAGPVTRKGDDLSKSITITESDIEVVKPNAGDTTAPGTIKPNSAHVLSIKSKFKLAAGMEIKPGDSFKVELSEFMDLKGIYDKELIDGLDIFAEGIGTIAKANYDYDKGIITYTFTDYANTYDLKDFETSLTGHIKRDKLKYSKDNVPVGIKMINDPDTKFGKINVVYELDTASYTDEYGNNLNIASKITRFNPQTGEFEHIIYVNREQNFSHAATLVYKPGTDVVNLHVEEFKIEEKWTQSQYRKNNINLLMPPSFYVEPNNTDFRKPTDDKYTYTVNDANPATVEYNTGDLNWDDTYIIRITGQIAEGKDRSQYNPKVRIDANDYNVWSAREDYVYEQWNKNLAEGKLEITAINPKNEITFKKVDQAGEILPGATFKLVKYNEGTKKWEDVEKSTKTSKQDGLIKYEKLAPGKYGLVETKAPEGFSLIEGHAAEFTVGDDGVITRKVKKPKDNKPVGETPGEPKDGGSALNPAGENQGASPGETPEKPKDENVDMVEVDEPVGNGPINIINYKDIEFVKVDAELNGENKKIFLEGAVFEVYKKDDKGKYQPVKVTKTKKAEDGSETTEQVTMTVTSDKDGKFKPKVNKPGDYALKEIKAPEGYAKIPGWIREFRLANGKLYTLEKDPIKASHTDSPHGMISSEVLSVDKKNRTFKQRIVINPNHKNFTIPNFRSYLRILENGWSITPKADGENKGGKVKVALIKAADNKKPSDLITDNFTDYSPVSYLTDQDGNTGSRYSLKGITGNGQTDDAVTTTDAIVVEYTGTLGKDKDITKVDQKAEVILNSSIADQVEYSLDWTVLTENKPVYDEYDLNKSIEVENRKAEYPNTGGPGMWIGYTIGGLALMIAGAYIYHKRKESIDATI